MAFAEDMAEALDANDVDKINYNTNKSLDRIAGRMSRHSTSKMEGVILN